MNVPLFLSIYTVNVSSLGFIGLSPSSDNLVPIGTTLCSPSYVTTTSSGVTSVQEAVNVLPSPKPESCRRK